MVDLPNVLARLDEAVARQTERDATPGLALALTDRLHAVRTYSLAAVAAGSPIAPETLFEINLISRAKG